MTELDLLLIRQREHEIAAFLLRVDALRLEGKTPHDREWMKIDAALCDLYKQKNDFIQTLEQQGHDYYTITAEMARIRAEVRGETK